VQQVANVEIRKDKNYEATDRDYQEQFAFLKEVRNKFYATQETIKNIKSVKSQIANLKSIQGESYPKDLDTLGKKINKNLNKVEAALYQNKAVSHQDVLNYPIKLNDKLGGLFRAANQETAPSQQVKDAYRELSQKIDEQLRQFENILNTDVAEYNRLVRNKRIDYIQIKREKP